MYMDFMFSTCVIKMYNILFKIIVDNFQGDHS